VSSFSFESVRVIPDDATPEEERALRFPLLARKQIGTFMVPEGFDVWPVGDREAWAMMVADVLNTARKEATAGVTVATGIQGYDLGGEMEDEDEDELEKAAQLALSLRRWRENSRNRLKKGKLPKRFVDVNIPTHLTDEIWGLLKTADTRKAVDDVFRDVGKSAAGERPAFHSQADRIVEHYSPLVAKAVRGLWPEEKVVAAALKVFRGNVRKGQAGFSKPFKEQMKAILGSGNTGPLKKVLQGLYGESWLQGLHDAGKVIGKPTIAMSLIKGMEVEPPESYWDSWRPGSVDLAKIATSGGLGDLLDAAGIQIKSIENTQVEHLGTVIGEGLEQGSSVEQVAQAIREQVAPSPDRSFMIANTEYARAMTAASMKTYEAAGVERLVWFSEDDERRCDLCDANAAASPIKMGEEWPSGDCPVHPNCRCAVGGLFAGEEAPEGAAPAAPAAPEAVVPAANAEDGLTVATSDGAALPALEGTGPTLTRLQEMIAAQTFGSNMGEFEAVAEDTVTPITETVSPSDVSLEALGKEFVEKFRDLFYPDDGTGIADSAEHSVSAELRYALANYEGPQFRGINGFLRGFAGLSYRRPVDHILRTMGIQKPLQSDIKVTRLLNPKVWSDHNYDALRVGDVFARPSFVSTTVPGVASAEDIEGSRFMMQIRVPKGTRGIYIGSPNLKGRPLYPGENEFLLPPRSRFKVLGINRADHIIDVELLP
jgi:SPP1 gp7 family putative phage head morphogenesis protein